MGLYDQSQTAITFTSIINRNHYVYKRNFTDRKRDGIPCVIIPWINLFLTVNAIQHV